MVWPHDVIYSAQLSSSMFFPDIPSTSWKREMRRLRLLAYLPVAIDFFHLDRPALVVVVSTKHTAACPQEGSHDITFVRSSSMDDAISQDIAVRDDVEEVVEETVVHGSSRDSRSGQDAVLGGPVG
ncbi:unnamed protein product [Prorocentrum cordatum]|uniref:Uncharacterized protein n=1 Tax=Prorocentrum cordatum TaxID=2364126 RepID=A0ABN9QDU2_9DINO|nr:unnamed protein product [Polarella glacialis]